MAFIFGAVALFFSSLGHAQVIDHGEVMVLLSRARVDFSGPYAYEASLHLAEDIRSVRGQTLIRSATAELELAQKIYRHFKRIREHYAEIYRLNHSQFNTKIGLMELTTSSYTFQSPAAYESFYRKLAAVFPPGSDFLQVICRTGIFLLPDYSPLHIPRQVSRSECNRKWISAEQVTKWTLSSPQLPHSENFFPPFSQLWMDAQAEVNQLSSATPELVFVHFLAVQGIGMDLARNLVKQRKVYSYFTPDGSPYLGTLDDQGIFARLVVNEKGEIVPNLQDVKGIGQNEIISQAEILKRSDAQLLEIAKLIGL